jgi:L-ascorbate metabolism protein UlaG (beta-lactamase superfamily)
MTMRVTWHGHGTFEITASGKQILIDPFFTGNPSAKKSHEAFTPEAIIVSHGHSDHVGDTLAIARRARCLVIANHEIATWLQKQGLENVHGMHLGGARRFPWGRVKLTMALHGSMLPDGSYGGNPCGVLLESDGQTLYHACDTGLFGDMALIGEGFEGRGLDVAILPIGDNYTMGPDDALRAVKLLKPRFVIPDHFGTWPLLAQDAGRWSSEVEKQTTTRAQTLDVAAPWSVPPR